MLTPPEENKNFYYEKLIPESDAIFRLAYFVSLNSPYAFTVTRDVFKSVKDQLEPLVNAPVQAAKILMLKRCWRLLKNAPKEDARIGGGVGSLSKKLSPQTRAVLFLKDYAGFTNQDIIEILEISNEILTNEISIGRKALVEELGTIERAG